MRSRVAVLIPLAVIALGCSAIIGDHPFSAMPKSKLGKPEPTDRRAWAGGYEYQYAKPSHSEGGDDSCDLTAFALTTSRSPELLKVDGVAQAPDTSWTVHDRVPARVQRVWVFEFIDPTSGATLACRRVAIACIDKGGAYDRVKAWEGKCEEPMRASAKAEKTYSSPTLVASASPRMSLPLPGVEVAGVRFRWEVKGPQTEEWYCPAFEVTWPWDGTRATRESDCDPWPGTGHEREPWTFFKPVPVGSWSVEGCILRGGKKIACQFAQVTVSGGPDAQE